jgi:integrase
VKISTHQLSRGVKQALKRARARQKPRVAVAPLRSKPGVETPPEPAQEEETEVLASSDVSLVVAPSSTVLAELRGVAEQARELADASQATATRKAYKSQWKAWTAWCKSFGFDPLPARPEALALYLTAKNGAGASVSWLAQALAAIGYQHKQANLEPPQDSREVRAVWKGIRRTRGTRPKHQATPLTPVELKPMCQTGEGLSAMRDRALLLVGWAAALRRKELIDLDVEHVQEVDEGLVVFIKRSKTDQEGEGEKIGVPYGSDRVTCPVRSFRAWLEVSGIKSGALFRGVLHGKLTEHRLTGHDVARIAKRAAKRAGLNLKQVSGHSLRSGFATTAAKARKPLHMIAKQTRHKSLAVLMGYIRDEELFEDNAASGIGL